MNEIGRINTAVSIKHVHTHTNPTLVKHVFFRFDIQHQQFNNLQHLLNNFRHHYRSHFKLLF
jgi:hypothetical protein